MSEYFNKYISVAASSGTTVTTPPWYKHGCMNPNADNYDAEANEDDGTCIIGGCMNPAASNYDPTATYDNGTCIIGGCMDPAAGNYDATATYDDGSCVYGLPVTSDIIVHLDAEAIDPTDITQVNVNNLVVKWPGSNGSADGIGMNLWTVPPAPLVGAYVPSDSLMNNKPYVLYDAAGLYPGYHKVTTTQTPVNEMTMFVVAKFELEEMHMSAPITTLEGYNGYQNGTFHINYAGDIGYEHQVNPAVWYTSQSNIRIDGTTNGINIASKPRHLIGVRLSPTNPAADIATADIAGEVITTLDKGPITSANWSAMAYANLRNTYGLAGATPSKNPATPISGTGKITSAGHSTITEFRLGAYAFASSSLKMFAGNVYEVLIYNKSLTDSEYTSVQLYLANKYGL